METISQRQMRNDSAAILRRVEAGESFIITNRGVEVARLTPFASRQSTERDALIAAGVLLPRKLGRRPLPTPIVTDLDVDALLDDLRGE